jgi:hypothetical protein
MLANVTFIRRRIAVDVDSGSHLDVGPAIRPAEGGGTGPG